MHVCLRVRVSGNSMLLFDTESKIDRISDFEKFALWPYSLEPRKSKVSVAYDRNSLSDRASSNDVATNDVNGRIGNKTWCKCECCALMETSVEDVCCLEIPEICQPRFSSTLCLYVYRSDSNFVQLYFKRENFCYLNSTQCWSLANQNKSLWLSFPVIIFCLYKRCFFGFFCENVFSREHSIRFRGLLLLKSNILSSESPEVIHGCSRTF